MKRVPFLRVFRDDLLAGRFAPGQPLSESALTSAYRVSRTPVRETLSRLEQEGLITRAVRGYRIRSGAPADVVEIYAVRIVLEQAAAEAASTRRTDLQLAQLAQLQRQAGAEADPGVARRLNSRWHEVLWGASQNATLHETLVNLIARLRVYDQDAEQHDDLGTVADEHQAILDAIEVGDGAGARDAITAHLQRTKRQRLDAFAQSAAANGITPA